MVKLDAERDYYKDLGLDDTADITEIKKQFKKLALKCHPDRNQDNVEDATKLFQVIGEAHEILSDPATKQKYDIARAKHQQASRARYPGASGVRGNPWQDVADQYPVPPRRQNPVPPRRENMPPRPRPTSTSHPTARQKYQNMFGGGGSGRADDESDTYSTFDTFQKYRQARSRGGKGTTASGVPNTSSQKSRPPPETPPRPTPQPRTAAQQEKADAAFGSRRGRTGYQPASPAAADEPPVSRSNYFSTGRHTNLFENATTNLREERQKAAEQGNSAESMDEDSDNFVNRQRRQYASSSGEKLDPRAAAGPDLGRTSSTREPRKTTNAFPPPRQRSASVPNVEEAPGFTQANNTQQGFKATSNGSATDFGTQGLHGESATVPGTAAPSTNTSSTSINGGVAGTSKPYPSTTAAPTKGRSSNTQNGNPSVFSFHVDDDTFKSTSPPKHPFASTSAEDINTSFARSDDGYNFSANTGKESGVPKHRATSASRLGRRSPLKKTRSGLGSESIERTHARQEKADDVPTNSANSSKSKFDANEWTNKINPDIFTPPPAPTPSGSPTRGRSGTAKKGKKPMVVDEQGGVQKESGGFGSATGSEPTSGGSPMAMDIDSPPANNTGPASARNIPVEPSRPDWRSGTHGGKEWNGNAVSSAPGTPSKPAPAAPGSKANPIIIGGSEDTDNLKASFADLRKTEPLKQPRATGLGEWEDMRTTLPFQSRASANIPVDRPLIKTKVPDMTIPRPPVPPAALVNPNPTPGVTLRTEDWMGYMASFSSYLEGFTRLDRCVISYLSEAQRELDERDITGHGYGWLHPGRDDATIKAYEMLCRDMQDVHEQWVGAWRMHRDALREMRLIRERIRLMG